MVAFETLTTYGETPVKQQDNRIDAIATISAGYKVKKTTNGREMFVPVASKDGTIHLHDKGGRAPGLLKLLKQTKEKVLTIAMPFDDPRLFIQQRFVRYSATRLEVYGDQNVITEIVPDGTKDSKGNDNMMQCPHKVGTPRYEELRASCKVATSLYFYLAEWAENGGARIIFPDGLGFYRLRFTSNNSLSNFLAQLNQISGLTGGRIAGVPLTLRLVNSERSDGDGVRRQVPLWTVTMQPPQQLSLDSGRLRHMLEAGIREADRLKLPPPRAELANDDDFTIDVDLDNVLDEGASRMLSSGVAPETRYRQWHGLVHDTELDTDEGRHNFLAAHTEYNSLKDVAKYLSDERWDTLMSAALKHIGDTAEAAQEAAGEARVADADSYPKGVTETDVKTLTNLTRTCKVKAANAWDFISWLSKYEVLGKSDVTLEVIQAAEARYLEMREAGVDVCGEFRRYLASDESAQQVLGL
jgi:hypothetical protein